MPKLGVMRFAISTEISVWRVPPSSGVLIVLTVGSESSSATKGSSVESVAGKNRAPAKPWPYARLVAPSSHTAQTIEKSITKCFMTYSSRKWEHRRDRDPRGRSSLVRNWRGGCNPCTRTAQPTRTRTSSGGSAVEERAANARTQPGRNHLLDIRKERTVAQYRSRETHRSYRSSAPGIANPVSFQNFLLC